MNIETLRLYCRIIQERSFSKGAAQRGVTQSAASQALRQLEGDLSVELLDRSKRPFDITEEGARFYEACRKLLGEFDQVCTDISHGIGEVHGQVRVRRHLLGGAPPDGRLHAAVSRLVSPGAGSSGMPASREGGAIGSGRYGRRRDSLLPPARQGAAGRALQGGAHVLRIASGAPTGFSPHGENYPISQASRSWRSMATSISAAR